MDRDFENRQAERSRAHNARVMREWLGRPISNTSTPRSESSESDNGKILKFERRQTESNVDSR